MRGGLAGAALPPTLCHELPPLRLARGAGPSR